MNGQGFEKLPYRHETSKASVETRTRLRCLYRQAKGASHGKPLSVFFPGFLDRHTAEICAERGHPLIDHSVECDGDRTDV
ncbi:hypothetical protein I7I50_06663 [Histoplasma capsulatum G186AR]|uniref:Uncharacterized protein n=1 Tax=Ajellomyces capsulatus TaxID=5037 RepID=A0A8H7YZ28_AJECA|nr:hypothetical protein I7I52_10263 [Histoplasma capsulatum]QSS67547.1 hypothetical protein I7I50_06663 [Histoplasma capsulatum G186AR]